MEYFQAVDQSLANKGGHMGGFARLVNFSKTEKLIPCLVFFNLSYIRWIPSSCEVAAAPSYGRAGQISSSGIKHCGDDGVESRRHHHHHLHDDEQVYVYGGPGSQMVTQSWGVGWGEYLATSRL